MNENEIMDLIYKQLEDNESKYIYAKRRQFNCSGRYELIGEIVDKYVLELSKWYPGKDEEMFHLIKASGKRVIIFGAGVRGR